MRPPKSIRFNTDQEYRLYRIRHFARKYGWVEMETTRSLLLFGHQRRGQLANLEINFTNSRITTFLQHPKRGTTKLVRKGILTERLVESLFRNPREHTGPEVSSQYEQPVTAKALRR